MKTISVEFTAREMRMLKEAVQAFTNAVCYHEAKGFRPDWEELYFRLVALQPTERSK